MNFSTKLIIILIFVSSNVFSQSISFFGKVINESTEEPISYSVLQIENSNISTVTNYDGEFRLNIPSKYINHKVIFSSVGYETKYIEIKQQKEIVYLKQRDIEIDEVFIIPDSNLYTLLERAYIKIPENYSEKPTKIKGFYRETLKTKKHQYLYFAESVIEMYKTSYNIKTNHDQVKIIKSLINEFSGSDTINNVRFYGSVFLADNLDVVKKRFDFINPKEFKKYNYRLSDITSFQNNQVYIVNFNTKDDSLKGIYEGRMYIDKETLAYIAFEFNKTKRGIDNYNSKRLGPFRLVQREYSVFYTKKDNKWNLIYIVAKKRGENTHYNTSLIGESEFIRTELFCDTIKPIPFNERVEYGDVFSLKAGEFYSNNYWSEYNVLEQDSLLKSQIKPLYTKNESKKILTIKIKPPKEKLTHKIIKNISFGMVINYNPVVTNFGEYSLSYNTGKELVTVSEHIKQFEYLLSYNINYSYKLHNSWEIDVMSYNSLAKTNYFETYDLGFSYRILLNKKTTPIILRTSLLFSYNNFSRIFPTYQNNEDFTFANKNIDAQKVQFSLGSKNLGVKPKISLEFKRKKRLWFTTSFAYLIPFKTTDKLYLQEKSGFFLTRKNESIDLINENTEIRCNGEQTNIVPVKMNNYSFDIGIMLRF